MSGKDEVSPKNKRLAKLAAAVFGGTPSANRHLYAAEKSSIDILAAMDSPVSGIVSFATFGLSDHPNPGGPKGRALPVEIVGACGTGFLKFDKALATAAFGVINSGWVCRAGSVFPGCLDAYGISKTMKHLFFIAPCLWSEELKPLKLGKKTVTWVMAVPISEEERRFVEKEGAARLDRLFEEKRIDIPDLGRRSVV